MCGLVAVTCPAGTGIDLRGPLAAIRHRGPDDEGIYASPERDCHLGHVRLSIVELSAAGHQPMADASGRFVMVYNGEIYNTEELRAYVETRSGRRIEWRGTSDTEVIVEGFACEGIDFLDRLNGMYALAIYDLAERVLHVLRDPLGIKPLVMTCQSGGVYFASELKGLLAIPGLARTLRLGALAEQIEFMYVPEPATPFQEFEKVAPGVCMSFRAGRLVASRRLCRQLLPVDTYRQEGEAVAALREALIGAVRRQLVADVPVSLFLSGGLDSSAVAQIALQGGATLRDAYTVAVTSGDRRYDEQSDDLRYARLMAERLGIELKVVQAQPNLLGMLPELVQFMDDGFSDPAAITTYLISAGARREGVKVLLSGQGADEFLGGYRRYVAERILSALPASLHGGLAGFARVLPERVPGRLNALSRRVKRLAEFASHSPHDRLKAMYTWQSEELTRALLPGVDTRSADQAFYDYASRHARPDVVDTMMAVDRWYDLLSLNLCYTDRMSMAAGVEARVPFLDFELVRTMTAIPAAMNVGRTEGKRILKRAMEGLLPRQIIHRPKAGFGLPIRAWLRQKSELMAHYLEPARLARQGIFDPATVRGVLDEQYSGRRDHSYPLLTLLTQQLWLDHYGIA